MKTVTITKEDLMQGGKLASQWVIVDAKGIALGRVATRVASLLRGKHKPHYAPHLDAGDFVVVINAEHIVLTGAKLTDKYYYHHTRYPGGLKSVQAQKLLAEKPTEMMRLAVKRMMPKNALSRGILDSKLKIYAGEAHEHQAQKPKAVAV